MKDEELYHRQSTGIPLAVDEKIHEAEEEVFVFPLSPAQQRLWFLNRLEPDSPVYTIPIAVRCSGTLDPIILEQSLQEIIRRHEILRTTFAQGEKEAEQAVHADFELRLHRKDLTTLTALQQENEVKQLFAEEMRRPFDLSQGPLLRVTLLQLNAQEHILLLLMHHIISDGWSLGVLLQELSTMYRALLTHRTSTLPVLPIQYADFAVWQRSWLQGEVLQEQLDYWRHQLAGIPTTLSLPTDHPRPRVQSFRGATITTLLPDPLLQQLQQFSQQEEVSLFMTLLTAFQVLLSRYSGQPEIVVGSPIANRQRRETEALIGFFVNTLVLRADLAGNPSFRQALQRVREVCLQAYSHQDVPFEQVVEALHPPRSLSYSPLFQVLFALQNMPLPPLELPGLTLQRVDLPSQYAHFDLSLSLQPVEQGLEITLEYATDLFEASSMQRLLTHYQRMLTQVVQDPQTPLLRLSLLDEAERACLLEQWGQGEARPIAPQCIHELFEQQVARSPQAIALQWGTQQLSYEQLNQKANQLAHALRARDVGPEVRVGICLQRDSTLVIALLAVLKAGGAYVPLDPHYPQERLAFLLQDAQMHLVLSQESSLAHLPAHSFVPVLLLDQAESQVQTFPTSNVRHMSLPQHLAYVLYTSGSTGNPKGVQIQHTNLTNFLQAIEKVVVLEKNETFINVTTFSFDIAALELYLPLLTGGRCVLCHPDEVSDGQKLQELLAQAEVTVMQATPATWNLLVKTGWKGNGTLLKVLCGGEALSMELAKQLTEITTPIWNLYGPTETTIWSSCAKINQVGNFIPLGQPLFNTQMYVLDVDLQLVPFGIPGELYLGGAGLARGYLNRPALTAERFLPNPFSAQPGARLYRTGDRVRYRDNGQLEFLGRLDEQVKLRGFRIELGEIEAALRLSPLVKEAVVVMREDRPDDRRLVAYVVLDPTEAISSVASSSLLHTLRQHLLQQLPEYMVPASLLVLEQMPLTPNGKLDRRVLPAPLQERGEQEHAYVAPRTPLEHELVTIWEDLLGISSISVTDDFFELGGHSLLAIQLMNKTQESFHITLPIRELFLDPTIAHLATLIKQQKESEISISATDEFIKLMLNDLSDEAVESLLQDPSILHTFKKEN